MNRALLAISIIGLLFIQSCSNREKREVIVFKASDELHYILLYENSEFEILYNGLNTAIGTYRVENDTIQLTYKEDQFEEFDPNEKLTRRILIDIESKRVKSIDDKKQFCANIQIDSRYKN